MERGKEWEWPDWLMNCRKKDVKKKCGKEKKVNIKVKKKREVE